MNLPVLFRTIDGTSQVTIETQYATELLRQSDGMANPPTTFLFLQKDMNHWFALTRLFACLRHADAPRGRRTTGDGSLSLYGRFTFGLSSLARWARSSVG
jgi:hypothetical protein